MSNIYSSDYKGRDIDQAVKETASLKERMRLAETNIDKLDKNKANTNTVPKSIKDLEPNASLVYVGKSEPPSHFSLWVYPVDSTVAILRARDINGQWIDVVGESEDDGSDVQSYLDLCADVINLTTDIAKNHTVNDSSQKKISGLNIYGESNKVSVVVDGENEEFDIVSIENPTITFKKSEDDAEPQAITLDGIVLKGIKHPDGEWLVRDEILVDTKEQKVLYRENITKYVLGVDAWPSHVEVSSDGVLSVAHFDGDLSTFNPKACKSIFDINRAAVYSALFSNKYKDTWGTPPADCVNLGYPGNYQNGIRINFGADRLGVISTDTEAQRKTKCLNWIAEYNATYSIPLTLYYAVQTPTETDITDTDMGQALLALHTNYPTTIITCDADCEITYKADTTSAFAKIAENGGGGGGNGLSAYEIAVENGFEGTEQEWLDSLIGSPGKSAYEVAVDNGFEGTEEEWFKSISQGGLNTTASGANAHAEGENTVAEGDNSHAEGYGSKALGDKSHAEGDNCQAVKFNTHAEGDKTIAHGGDSHSEGMLTTAVGDISHSEGANTLAYGDCSHAEGFSSEPIRELFDDYTNITPEQLKQKIDEKGTFNIAYGDASHTEGKNNISIGESSHSEGKQNISEGTASHTEGQSNTATGHASHSEGEQNVSSGAASHTEGTQCKATGKASHAEGYKCEATKPYAHAEGNNSIASNNNAHAEGAGSQAKGEGSHAENNSIAEGMFSHSEGRSKASNSYAHAEGYDSIASGYSSHAEGTGEASGFVSHAEGDGTHAVGSRAHAEGFMTWANGANSHAEGIRTKANGRNQHVQGVSNIPDNENDYLHIVGNGAEDGTRESNAHTLDWFGNAWYAGDIYVGGTSQYDTQAKKVAIETQIETYTDVIFGYDFARNNNREVRASTTESIIFAFSNGEYPETYTSGLSFDSGETPTSLNYSDSGILNWVGTDCVMVDGWSIFQPSANTHYDIVFYFNGTQFIGLVNGFVPSVSR